MSSFEELVLGYLVNSLWQVPLISLAAYGCARLVRRMGPQAEQWVWVAALLAAAILPACAVTAFRTAAWLWRARAGGRSSGSAGGGGRPDAGYGNGAASSADVARRGGGDLSGAGAVLLWAAGVGADGE